MTIKEITMAGKKFHINPETGRPNQCTATVRDCKYAVNGEMPEHYDSKEEAQKAVEKTLSKEFGNVSSVKKGAKKQKEFNEPTTISVKGYGQNAWIGSKRNAHNEKENGYLSAKDISTNVRQDIKEAVAAGYLPKELKYSTVLDKYAGGFSVRTRISGLGSVYKTHDYDPQKRRYDLKPEYQEIVEKVNKIHDSWNYDDSNMSADYFNRGFYGDVRVITPYEEKYNDYQKSLNNLNKIAKNSSVESDEYKEAEKEYYEKLHDTIKTKELEVELFTTAEQLKKKPDGELYDAIEEKAEAKAELTVINAKKKQAERLANRR